MTDDVIAVAGVVKRFGKTDVLRGVGPDSPARLGDGADWHQFLIGLWLARDAYRRWLLTDLG